MRRDFPIRHADASLSRLQVHGSARPKPFWPWTTTAAFRGQVEFRINNDTEQFLVIRLPADTKLWTASVAGEPVKPTETPAANDPRLVRIPLVKTAEGDPDYGVVLKYGGRVQLPGGLQPVEFPIIHTVNVNVELSQVRLMLPPTQQWFYFGGTMRRVADEGEYRARDLVHLTRQIRIAQQALSSANPYTRLRASNNLKQLDSAVSSYQQNYRRYSGNEFVEEQLDTNAGANVQAQAQRQIAESDDDKSAEPDNRRDWKSCGKTSVLADPRTLFLN